MILNYIFNKLKIDKKDHNYIYIKTISDIKTTKILNNWNNNWKIKKYKCTKCKSIIEIPIYFYNKKIYFDIYDDNIIFYYNFSIINNMDSPAFIICYNENDKLPSCKSVIMAKACL